MAMKPSRHPGNVPLSAVLLIVGAVGCFAILDSIVKFLAVRYSVPLLVWARYTLQAVAIVLWLGVGMALSLATLVARGSIRTAGWLAATTVFPRSLPSISPTSWRRRPSPGRSHPRCRRWSRTRQSRSR